MPARNHHVSLAESKHHVIDPANLCRALDDRVEDRLHIRRRPADDAKHLSRRCLMLQCFAQFCIALLDLLEQAHIFNGDRCLVCEGFEQSDLLVGKRPYLHPPDVNASNRLSFSNKGVASMVRAPDPLDSGNSSSSACKSRTWMVWRSIVARPLRVSRLAGMRSMELD